jgi:hypothetical protein
MFLQGNYLYIASTMLGEYANKQVETGIYIIPGQQSPFLQGLGAFRVEL